MEALQKFKLLATQCAVMGSPTRSPATSPVVHIRRRRTLRMLLSHGGSSGRRLQRHEKGSNKDKEKELVVRQKLRDLFVSSPPSSSFDERLSANVGEGVLPANGFPRGGGCGFGSKRNANRSLRPVPATFRQRLIRRAWRPVLVTIPE